MTPVGADGDESAIVETTAAGLQERYVRITAEMTAAIMETVDSLDDAEMTRLLSASVEANVDTILHMLRNGIPARRTHPATAAIEYAIRLAQRDVPESSLRRAYHIGAEVLRRWMFEVLNLLEAPTEAKLRAHYRLEGFLYEYIDAVTQAVLEAHATESVRRAQSTASQVGELIERLLDGHEVNADTFDAVTGYRLGGAHRGAVVWITDPRPGVDHTGKLRELADRLAGLFNRRRLFATVDREMAWVWFADAGGQGPDADALDAGLEAVLADFPGCRVAFGSPQAGAAGFRDSHRQAVAAKRVAAISHRSDLRAVRYDMPGVALAALLADDLPGLKCWVAETLGGLADDTEAAERLRVTLRVFLESDRSHTRAGARLNLHRNSVKYRVDKARALCGGADAHRVGDLVTALTLCGLFGAPVLRAPAA